MSDFEKYLRDGAPSLDPDKEFRTKDGAHFEEALHYWWGATATRMPFGIKKQLKNLGEKYGWLELYDVVKFAAEMDKKNYRYVEVSLDKRVVQAKEKATAKKIKMVHCPKCYESYWNDRRHECTIEFLDGENSVEQGAVSGEQEKPEDVRRKITEIKKEWENEL